MNTHEVIRPFRINGVEVARGTLVDASQWRNRRLMEDQGRIRLLDGVTVGNLSASAPAVDASKPSQQFKPKKEQNEQTFKR